MNYLLDTNACIALINDSPAPVRARLAKALDRGDNVLTSAITAYELWFGVSRSTRPESNAKRVEMFFSGPVGVLPFEDADARITGSLRATLESAGKPIGAYDLLIAGQALRHKLTVVTANVREFRRVKGLRWEDWAKD